ncbi:MAG: hypothetical protein RR202_08505 [Bacteroidales bacterium]
MKKIVLITLFILLVVAVLGALFIPNKLILTWIVFTLIDLCLLTLLFIYFRHARKMKTLENTKSNFRESEQDEILFICKKICEENKSRLAELLKAEIIKGDPTFVDNWAKSFIPEFIHENVYPAVKNTIPNITNKRLIGAADEMNMIVFKVAFDAIDKDEIPDDLLRQLNIE